MINLSKNEIIVFAGDSITDGGRSRNMDLNHNLGHGYQYILAAKLGLENIEKTPKFINKGYSGASISVVNNSWYQDVITYNPGLISILIGINDIFRGYADVAAYVAEKFEKTYDMLLNDTKKLLPNTEIILCEPFFIHTKNQRNFIAFSPNIECEEPFEIGDVWTAEKVDYIISELHKLQLSVRKLAKEYHCIFVPLQEEFDKACETVEAEYLLWDGVHPTVVGHEIIAKMWYKCVEERKYEI